MTSKEHPTATITTPNSTPGQSGRFGSERVAAFRRNQWPLSSECARMNVHSYGMERRRVDELDASGVIVVVAYIGFV